MNPFSERIFQAAVSQIELRAEHQLDLAHLSATYVDPGIAVQVQNDNSQIIYGRRGTGKTHLLKVTRTELLRRNPRHRLAIYLDMRHLGSCTTFEDVSRPYSVRAASLLRDVLEIVHDGLLTHLTEPHVEIDYEAFEELNGFARAIVRTVMQESDVTLEAIEESAFHDDTNATLKLATTPGMSLSMRQCQAHREALVEKTSGRRVDKLVFGELSSTLTKVIASGRIAHFTLLVDEWSHVPYDLQPMLAEFMRKALLTIPNVAIKIAALEYRSNFRDRRDEYNGVIGFEMGADISAALELDEYYVSSTNRQRIANLFASVLIKHLRIEVDRQAEQPGYFDSHYGILDRAGLVELLFASDKMFLELVRSGEGVTRDYLNVFAKAYFAAMREGSAAIDLGMIRNAATEWYELDKAPNIGRTEAAALKIIVEQVIARNGTATFMLSRDHERSPLICAMVDLRLIHPVQRGVRPDKNNPANRFNVYALDYGIYAHMMGTSSAPLTVLVPNRSTRELIVLDGLVSRLDEAITAPPSQD